MTEREFANTNPERDKGILLLFSSSIDTSSYQLSPPLLLIGMSINFPGPNGEDLYPVIREADKIKFSYRGDMLTIPILSKVRKPGFGNDRDYFYIQLEETYVNALPDPVGNVVQSQQWTEPDCEITFIPYVKELFRNNDYNPLINNSVVDRLNSVTRVVDYTSNQLSPSNLQAILSSSAEIAEIPDSLHTSIPVIAGRYEGSKSTAATGSFFYFNKDSFTAHVSSNFLPGNDPALSFKSFEGSIHVTGSNDVAIANIPASERKKQNIYFNSIIEGPAGKPYYPDFPELSGSYDYYLYEDRVNNLVRIPNSKIYATERNVLLETDENGKIRTIITGPALTIGDLGAVVDQINGQIV